VAQVRQDTHRRVSIDNQFVRLGSADLHVNFSMADVFFALLLSFLAIFLILLVLVQRGRGGGLAGALGGMGGSSAFGAKAGDVFTKITIITASVWIAVCLVAVFWAKHGGDAFSGTNPNAAPARTEQMNPATGTTTGGGTTVPASTGTQPPASTSSTEGGAATQAESAPATSGNTSGSSTPAENP
jgi:preprotein translocase subunit SecG